MTALNLYDSSKYGVPILHDTNLDFVIDKIEKGNMLRKTESFYSEFMMDPDSSMIMDSIDDSSVDLIQIKSKVINPLKVSLSRNQYQQLLDTIKSPTQTVQPEQQEKDREAEEQSQNKIHQENERVE